MHCKNIGRLILRLGIDLLFQSGYLEELASTSQKTDLTELLKLLISIIKTSKANGKR